MDPVYRNPRLVAVGILLILATPVQLPAYLDPGSGSYVLQMLVAALVGASFAVKTFWKQLRAFFSRSASRRSE